MAITTKVAGYGFTHVYNFPGVSQELNPGPSACKSLMLQTVLPWRHGVIGELKSIHIENLTRGKIFINQ